MSFKFIFKVIEIFNRIVGFIGSEKIYKFLFPYVKKQIEKIDLEDDELEEKTEDLIETVVDLVLRFILGIPLDKEIN